jgi:hypothetical protein
MLIKVDLPAPFSPMMPVIAPFSIDERHAAHGVHAAERLVDPVELDRRTVTCRRCCSCSR